MSGYQPFSNRYSPLSQSTVSDRVSVHGRRTVSRSFWWSDLSRDKPWFPVRCLHDCSQPDETGITRHPKNLMYARLLL